ncbi:hypothetical protein CsatA_001973 [Cannabis sativa]
MFQRHRALRKEPFQLSPMLIRLREQKFPSLHAMFPQILILRMKCMLRTKSLKLNRRSMLGPQ